MNKELKEFMEKNSSNILTGVGATGVVITTGLAIRATVKSMKTLEKLDSKTRKDMTKWDTFKLIGSNYISTGVSGLTSIACIVGANRLSNNKIVALTSVCAAVEKKAVDYQKKVEEEIGVDKATKIKKEFDKEQQNKSQTILVGDPLIFYDEYTGRAFYSNRSKIDTAVGVMNDLLIADGFVTLNSWSEQLGLDYLAIGDDMGWSIEDGGLHLNYNGTVTDDGRSALMIGFDRDPSKQQ